MTYHDGFDMISNMCNVNVLHALTVSRNDQQQSSYDAAAVAATIHALVYDPRYVDKFTTRTNVSGMSLLK